MPYDASNRKDIRRAEKEAKVDETMRIDYLRSAMSTLNGRAWFYEHLEYCQCFADIPTFDPYKDAFFKGVRNVGLRTFADLLAHCPDYYIQMIKEANDRRTARDARRPASDEPDDATSSERSGSADSGWDPEGPIGDQPGFLNRTYGLEN